MCPEYPTNNCRGKSCWLHPRESGPEDGYGPGLSRLGMDPARITCVGVDRGVFRVLLGLLPPRPSPEKGGHEDE